MKKVLLASTALIASAGVAAADVTVGGSGRMGVIDQLGLFEGPDDLGFTSRIRIQFTGSGETDGGLSFGGSIRADNAGSGNSGTGGSVFISGDFGTLTMGDVSGAPEAAVGDVSGVGLTGLGDTNDTIYLSNNARPAMRYDYSFGDFGVHVSADNPTGANEVYGVALTGAFAGFDFGLGYESADYGIDTDFEIFGEDEPTLLVTVPAGTSADHIVGGLTGTFGGFTGQAIYGQAEFDLAGGAGTVDLEQYQLSVDYSFGATTLTAFYANLDFSNAVNLSGESYGIGAAYDLGGGAALEAGYVDASLGDSSDEAFDFGISFNF